MFQYKGGVSGPRWDNLGPFIRQVAWHTNCKVIDLITDGGWLFENVYYTVQGTEKQVDNFRALLTKALE